MDLCEFEGSLIQSKAIQWEIVQGYIEKSYIKNTKKNVVHVHNGN